MKLSRGEKFVEARKIHNKNGKQTQKEVYAATGIPASKIKDLEDDDKNRGVDYREIVKLARYYGVSLEYLIGDSDDPHPEPSQQAAAGYLGLTDFETKTLARWINGSHFKRELFKKMLRQNILCNILSAVDSTACSIKVLSASLNNENARITNNEVRHIQRDLGEDIATLLSPVTDHSSICREIDRILEQEKQEIALQNYIEAAEEHIEAVKDYQSWKEAANGEHTED